MWNRTFKALHLATSTKKLKTLVIPVVFCQLGLMICVGNINTVQFKIEKYSEKFFKFLSQHMSNYFKVNN